MRQVTGNNPYYGGDGETADIDFVPEQISNPNQSRELSIQITLNGFSFLVAEFGPDHSAGAEYESEYGRSDDPSNDVTMNVIHTAEYQAHSLPDIIACEPMLEESYARVAIGFSTDRSLLIPHALFDPQRASQYLDAANLTHHTDATLYNATLSDTAVAVWQSDSQLIDALSAFYPEAYLYHTIQLHVDQPRPNSVSVIVDDFDTPDDIGRIAHIIVSDSALNQAETIQFHTPDELLYYTCKLLRQDGFTGYHLNLVGRDTNALYPLFDRYFASISTQELPYYNHHKFIDL